MAKQNFSEQSTEKLKKLKLRYNFLTVVALIGAIVGIYFYDIYKDQYSNLIFALIAIFIVVMFPRNLAIQIKKELGRRGDK